MTGRLLDAAPDDPASLTEHVRRHGPVAGLVDDDARLGMLAAVEASGLTGRGGAGFPLGRKLRTVAMASAGPPVVVANGCEGEPASRKDSWLLSRVPHLVLDGIQVAADVVRADQAHLVVHRGSPALRPLKAAVEARRGADRVPVAVHELPPRYVSSEETAIIRWLNGADARPTFTPPRPFEEGVDRRPTLVNNVETLAHLALLRRHGADWFRSVGDPDSPGTMLLSVTGPPDVARLLEVPTGTTVGSALALAGVDHDHSDAVVAGGYFGSWIPMHRAREAALTHRGMTAVGSALGAGIIVALPRTSCGITETARVAAYLATHSAGQCGPCVNGLASIAAALRALARGPWDERWAPALDRWLHIVPGRGACRLPDGATRFVASALTTFADDVALHRAGRPCAASAAAPWLPLPAPPALQQWR